jgi:non-ribosomal peptide synthetase component F
MFVNWFIESSHKFPQRPALEVNNFQLSYRELGLLSGKVALAIQKQNIMNRPIGLLTHRSLASYAGVLGIMYSKNIYLPLNPYFPLNRTKKMIGMVNCRALVIGNECKDYFLKLLPDLPEPMTFIFSDATGIEEISKGGEHQFIILNELEDAHEFEEIRDIDEDAIAYFVFTSGSTGEPKIVPQTNINVFTYLDYVSKRYRLDEHDRVSQTFELTFDNSIHDMFICWKYGACLYCVPRNYVMMPSGFIKDKKLTVWYSVPTIV